MQIIIITRCTFQSLISGFSNFQLVYLKTSYFLGWVEPLISRINQNLTAVVYPNIEAIGGENLQMSCILNVTDRGVFNLHNLFFQWQNIPETEVKKRQSDAEPVR